MAKDKYNATWVSHSSITDFLNCPRAYYLNNVYKDPKTNHKINLMAPPLALGQAVHAVIESLADLPTEKRLEVSLLERFQDAWEDVSGKKGGFQDNTEELKYKRRGTEMIQRVMKNPGPIKNKAIKLAQELPHFWLSEEHNIILCGKIDWIEYLPETDRVRIIDFKTGKNEEDIDSLQLPIYYLLAKNTQSRDVEDLAYWYLEYEDEPQNVGLPNEDEAFNRVLEVAKRIMVARKLDKFTCRNGEKGCFACRPLEKVINGEAEFVGVGTFKQDIYILPPKEEIKDESIIH